MNVLAASPKQTNISFFTSAFYRAANQAIDFDINLASVFGGRDAKYPANPKLSCVVYDLNLTSLSSQILTHMPIIVFLLSILSLAVSCTRMDKADRIYKTAHFKIIYTKLDDTSIKEIADSLENSYPKITSHLQSGGIGIVNVHFYENIVDLMKAFPDFPVWAVGQAISVSEIHMISPNDPKQDYQTMIRNTKHEFAHCVSIKINPTISNNPRWLWESIALFEANLPWDPHMLPYLVSQKPPSLKELNELTNQNIYEVGYFLAQFIAETYGATTLKSLIQNNGNLKDTLKIDDKEFTKQWFAFVKKKYGL